MSSNIIWNVFVYHNMAPTLYLRIFFKCFYLKDMTLIQFSETANHTCCSPWTAATLRLFWCASCASGGLPPSPGRCQCFAQIAANIKGRSIVVHSSGQQSILVHRSPREAVHQKHKLRFRWTASLTRSISVFCCLSINARQDHKSPV